MDSSLLKSVSTITACCQVDQVDHTHATRACAGLINNPTSSCECQSCWKITHQLEPFQTALIALMSILCAFKSVLDKSLHVPPPT